MPASFKGRSVMISGATGIAAATARLAAGAGAKIFLVSINRSDCEALAGELRARGAVCEYAVADLRVAAEAAEAVAACTARFPRIDALFNVVGASGRPMGDAPLHECTEQGWDATIALNLKTMFLLTRPVLEHMLAQEFDAGGLRGAILNMGSVMAASPQGDYFATHAYAAAKGAVESLTRAAAAYYARHGIRFNAITPGLVRTPMSLRAQDDEEIMDFIRRKQPLSGGMLEAADVARAALFLLSDEARYITGETLSVDGGWKVS